MGRSGGDGFPGGGTPGDEPEPAELWITGGSGGPVGGSPGGTGHGGSHGTGGIGSRHEGHGSGAGGFGGPGRNRWIALAAGFVVLVAVIAVQHFAGGHPTASPGTTTGSSSAPATPSPSPSTGRQPTTTPSAPSNIRSSAGGSASEREPTPSSVQYDGAPTTEGARKTAPAEPGDASAGTRPPPDTTSPTTTSVPTQAMRSEGNWELVGYGPSGVVRYRPATGTVVITPVPTLDDDYTTAFVATRTSAIVSADGSGVGYLVASGKPATILSGSLRATNRVLPGPDSRHLWVAQQDSTGTSLVLVTASGESAGTTIQLPAMLSMQGGYGMVPDGAGHVLVNGVGGIYDIRADGAHLVTHGAVLAAGPTAFLVYECDDRARCTTSVIDRKSGDRRRGPKLGSQPVVGLVGVISPDGRYAALLSLHGGPSVELVDLDTGRIRTPEVTLGTSSIGIDLSSLMVFTPDSRTLLVANSWSSLSPVDTATGDLLTPLPLPPMGALAVVPGN